MMKEDSLCSYRAFHNEIKIKSGVVILRKLASSTKVGIIMLTVRVNFCIALLYV
jgi:hypothetical protein